MGMSFSFLEFEATALDGAAEWDRSKAVIGGAYEKL
jgi:hypothetical protein